MWAWLALFDESLRPVQHHVERGLLAARCWRAFSVGLVPLVPRAGARAVRLLRKRLRRQLGRHVCPRAAKDKVSMKDPGPRLWHTFAARMCPWCLVLGMACRRGWGPGTENSDRLA